MNEVRIAAIVEGHGECEAVPILVRRIASEIDPGFVPCVLHLLRVPASRLVKAGELERSVELAARKLQGPGGTIIMVDCDWPGGCPKREAPPLLDRATKVRPAMPVCVILANPEYEAWFVAAAESLQGERGLSERLASPPDPESIRDAKGWLSQWMKGAAGYSETRDQPALTSIFDMSMARQRADSFDKCYRDIRRMLEKLRRSPSAAK